ncbi:MAG: hypothetical protein ACLRX7_06670 [Acutalibacteraceae bacterium]
MRHYRRGEHGKTSLKMKRIKNIAATLHQTQSGTSHGGKCDHTQHFPTQKVPFIPTCWAVIGMTYDDEAPYKMQMICK